MPHLKPVWVDEDPANEVLGTSLEAASYNRMLQSVNALHKEFLQATAQRRGFVLKEETALKIIHDGKHYVCGSTADQLLDARELLDADADLLPGSDYYIYACLDDSDPLDVGFTLKVSLNSTYPDGWTEQTSRKIGGFHTLCADAGIISGHPLSGFLAGDILPLSVWCLTHRPFPCSAEGMIYVPEVAAWVDIYLQSGTGTMTQSVYGATITDTRTWDNHNEDLFMVGKRMLTDSEFSCAMEGSNQKTNIKGSADPVTTGGHVDTTGRRMLSKYGLEDGCGAMWQWLDNPSANGGSTWGVPGVKGCIYGNSYAVLAGGAWSYVEYNGSRSRVMGNTRRDEGPTCACRGRARSRI